MMTLIEVFILIKTTEAALLILHLSLPLSFDSPALFHFFCFLKLFKLIVKILLINPLDLRPAKILLAPRQVVMDSTNAWDRGRQGEVVDATTSTCGIG